MLLNTKHFGNIEIDDKEIIDFPEGLPGFENTKRFVLLTESEDTPFQWLQGVDNTELAFVIIDPRYFKQDYLVDVDDEQVKILEIKENSCILVYSIVVIPEDATKMTANLRAPLLINLDIKKGKQVILDKGGYQTKHYIMEELQKIGG